MTPPRWEDGLKLDDSPGPARPVTELEAERMVQRALEEMAPPRRRGVRWGWAAAAAVALFIVAPAAVAAFQTLVLPIWRPSAPGGQPPRRAVPPPVAPEPDLGPMAPDAPVEVEPSAPAAPADPVARRRRAPRPERRIARRLSDPPGLGPDDGPDEDDQPESAPNPPSYAPRRTAPSFGRRQAPPPPRPPPPRLSAEAMLAAANRLRAARAFGEAAEAYAEVRRHYPRSGPAYVASVAEGQLLLLRRNSPRAALSAFNAAERIRPDGPLDAEILFGRGAAHWALRRYERARAIWRRLSERYPGSAPARRAEERLKSSP